MNQELQAASHEVSHDKDTLVENVRALMAATAHMAEEKVTEARKGLAAALDSGVKIFGRVEEKAIEGAKCTDKAVHEHPYQAIAIAFGAGAFVGFLVSHR